MLQRTLQRSFQRPATTLRHSGHVCACACGAPIHHVTARRGYARRAPSTRDREFREESYYLTPAMARLREQGREKDKHQIYERLATCYAADIVAVAPNTAIDFLNDFDLLVQKSRGRPTVDQTAFKMLLQDYEIGQNDCHIMGRILIQHWDTNNRYRGRKLIYTLSRIGHEEATIYIMAHAVTQHKSKPATLRSSEIAPSRAHLSKIAKHPFNFRAKVLEGKVALAVGDEETAIKMWTQAMAAAVEASEQSKPEEGMFTLGQSVQADHLELSSPWHELMLLHHARTNRGKDEMKQCQWAVQIGCDQDDPTAHYYASFLNKREDSDGNHIATSDWLYHITKAACSDHQKAAHELAMFYAQSGWKYIEDEPPDDIKPTPFDSYPAPKSISSTWDQVRVFFGAKPVEPPSGAQIFHAAVFPSTAEQRLKMAYEWNELSIRYLYAPAFLFRARMHMQKTLWGRAHAPKAALQLSNSRYDYASKEDFEAGKPIEKAEDPEPEDPPNPSYNLDYAKSFLREVFFAHKAHGLIDWQRKDFAKKRRRGEAADTTDDDQIIAERSFRDHPQHIRKWFRFPEVREMYEDEIESLYQEAKDICNEHGWDLYEDDGGLVYKASWGGTKKPAAAAAAA